MPLLPDLPFTQSSAYHLAICMWYDTAIASSAGIAADINRRYAERHGFAFVSSDVVYSPDRRPSWQRLSLMLRTLEGGVQGTPVAAVLWLDADAVFLHENGDALAAQLEAHGIVGGGRGPDILLSGDRPSDLFVNTGVMVVRNTPYARAWLRWFISLNASRPETSKDAPICLKLLMRFPWEQGCIGELWHRNASALWRHAKLLPYGALQTAAAPPQFVRPSAPIVHFMHGIPHLGSRTEPMDQKDREDGLQVVKERTDLVLSGGKPAPLPLVKFFSRLTLGPHETMATLLNAKLPLYLFPHDYLTSTRYLNPPSDKQPSEWPPGDPALLLSEAPRSGGSGSGTARAALDAKRESRDLPTRDPGGEKQLTTAPPVRRPRNQPILPGWKLRREAPPAELIGRG